MSPAMWTQGVDLIEYLNQYEKWLNQPVYDENPERQLVGMMLTYSELCLKRDVPEDSFVDQKAQIVYNHLPDHRVDYPVVETAESLDASGKLSRVTCVELNEWMDSYLLSDELDLETEYGLMCEQVKQWRKKKRLLKALRLTHVDVLNGTNPDKAINILTNRIYEGVNE